MPTKKEPSPKKGIAEVFKDMVTKHDTSTVAQPQTLWQRFWQYHALRVWVGISIIVVVLGVGMYHLVVTLAPDSAYTVDYVPNEATVYVEFNLTESKWRQLIEDMPGIATVLNDFFAEQGMVQEVINQAQVLAYVRLDTKEYSKASAWLIKTDNPRQLELLVPGDTFVKQLSDTHAVITQNERALKQFTGSKLSRRIKFTRSPEQLWNGYVHTDALADVFSLHPESRIDHHVFSFALDTFPKRIEFQTQLREDELFTVFTHSQHNLSRSSQKTRTIPPILRNADIVFDRVEIDKTVSELIRVVTQLPLVERHWGDLEDRMSSEYGITETFINTVLDVPFSVAVSFPYDGFRRQSGADQLTYLPPHIFTAWSNGGVSVSTAQEISNMLRAVIARTYPVVQSRELPDGTVMKERIADISAHEFSVNELVPDTYSVNDQTGDPLLLLLDSPERYIISNNITQYIAHTTNGSVEVETSCGSDAAAQEMFASGTFLERFPLLVDFDYAVAQLRNSSVSICLIQ